jgi:hypothetical protein
MAQEKKYNYAYLLPAIAWYRVTKENGKTIFKRSSFNHLEMDDYKGQVTPSVKVPGSMQEQWKNYHWIAESGYMEGGVFKPLQLYENGKYVNSYSQLELIG